MLSYTFYILERLFSWSTSRICPSWPCLQARLDILPALFHMYLLVCLGPPSMWLFVPTISVSHVPPPLPTGRLNTSTQVNNMTMLHLMHNSHTYIYTSHKYNYLLLFHTSSTLLGRPAGPDRLERLSKSVVHWYFYVPKR
jgi:hypothetical protein